MVKKPFILMIVLALFSFAGATESAAATDDNRSLMLTILRETPQVLEKGKFLLEFAPYFYRYKSATKDWISASFLLKAEIGPAWELSVGSDFLSYQKPDFGLADLYMGAKWKFYEKDALAMALLTYVDFPTGKKEFREPGIEPTLTFLVSRKMGDFEAGLTAGTTYAADSDGEPCYFDFEMSVELDYTPDPKNSFGVFTSGYAPDQMTDGSPRLSIGGSYTRTLNNRQSAGVMLMKGLSGRGMDWSCTVIYDYTF